jgi:ADP-heptose:LPS heptosyltransferase
MIALIEKSHIFIANSTGPLHIAAALGKYVIGFYPNQLACSSKRWGPYSDKSYVFTPEGECEDCKREQCASPDCMNSIKVTDVFGRVQEICQILENNGEINE